jgi:tRNA nucleotidyltransferase (CCA-adding enzyme)
MKICYPVAPEAQLILTRLNEAGHEAFLVGGYVRNLILGRPVTDLDITTSASPSAVLALFSDHKTSRIGERLGTIGIKVNRAWVEVTTYRIEGTSTDARHPDHVEFTSSLMDDLQRRDFTINALVMDRFGTVFDGVDGLADLNAQRIRAIGHPDARFQEDALRILRALRFGAQLGFSIEHTTGEALLRHQALLDTLPVERIRGELDKLIAAKSLETVFYPFFSVLARCVSLSPQGLAGFEAFEDPQLKWLTLLEHLSPQAIEQELLRLKFPKRMAAAVHRLAKWRTVNAKTPLEIKGVLREIGVEGVIQVMTYQDVKGIEGIDPDLFATLMAQDPVVSLKQLAINGHDLMALGLHGKAIQRTLNRLLDGVITEQYPNSRERLLQEAHAFLDEKA